MHADRITCLPAANLTLLPISVRVQVKGEVLRNVWDHMQPVDLLPKGRQLVNDDEYLSILKDMFNLSNILDDMEQTGWIPYHTRGHYYNVYSRLYRMLSTKAKMQPQ
jgi:hypothetical protein